MGSNAIFWRKLDTPGHEACRLSYRDSCWHLDGAAVFLHDHRPCRLEYHIVCDAGWRTGSAAVRGYVGDDAIDVRVTVDPDRQWTINGNNCPGVSGCVDIDLNFSPSTNLLPVRRLNLAVGEKAGVRAAWLRFPEFTLEPLEQIYHRTGRATYRYGSGDFRAELRVNADGFVVCYPGLWEREG